MLATQESEIRRIMVPNQPWANSSQDPALKIPNAKRASGVLQRCRPSVQAPVLQKKKKAILNFYPEN
jgi:hypothetical protein